MYLNTKSRCGTPYDVLYFQSIQVFHVVIQYSRQKNPSNIAGNLPKKKKKKKTNKINCLLFSSVENITAMDILNASITGQFSPLYSYASYIYTYITILLHMDRGVSGVYTGLPKAPI
jgi:hypothetical protein